MSMDHIKLFSSDKTLFVSGALSIMLIIFGKILGKFVIKMDYSLNSILRKYASKYSMHTERIK